MTTHQFQPRLSLSRPGPLRVVDRLLAVARAGWDGWTARRRRAHQFDAVMDLSPSTLKDIGAPDWLVSASESRREVDAHRLDEMRLGGRELPSRW